MKIISIAVAFKTIVISLICNVTVKLFDRGTKFKSRTWRLHEKCQPNQPTTRAKD